MKLTAAYLQQQWIHLRHNPLLTNSTYFWANTLAVSGLGFVFWWVAARLYPVENIGLTIVLISTAQFLTTIAQFGLSFGLIRFLPMTEIADRPALINVVLTYAGGLTFFLTIITIIVGPYLSPVLIVLDESKSFAAIFVFFVMALALFQLTYPLLAVLRAGNILLWTNVVTVAARIGLVVIFSQVINPYWLILAFALPTAIAAVVVLGWVLPKLVPDYKPHFNISIGRWRHVLNYSASSYVSTTLHDLPYQVLPQIVANQIGIASAAYFFVAWNFFSLLTTLGSSISLSLFVEGSYKKNIGKMATKTIVSVVATTAFLVIIVAFLAKPLLLIFGPDYALNGVTFLRIIAIAAIPTVIVYTKVAALRVKMKLGMVMIAFTIIASISLLVTLTSFCSNLVAFGWVWVLAQAVAAIYVLIGGREGEPDVQP